MSTALNYARMPGFGDLPGDSQHPNSPSYVEPAYGYEDADADIAAELVDADEVAELVMEVREAAGLLDWIAHNVDLPAHLLHSFRDLDCRARGLRCRADELCEAAS